MGRLEMISLLMDVIDLVVERVSSDISEAVLDCSCS